jgi:hypothetical protein
MSVIPVRLPPLEVHIHADRRLTFQVITAFGASQGLAGSRSRVLGQDEDGRQLVEFHTPAEGLTGRQKVYRTVERVTLFAPERVEFEGVEGPLTLLHDRFLLQAEGNCTLLRYESQAGIRGWLLGWLIARFYARPRLERLMRAHLEEMKDAVEARARRSKVYPQLSCDQEHRHDVP